MGWNNRIVEHNYNGHKWYCIHEAYYGPRSNGTRPWGITKDWVTPIGEDVDDLIKGLDQMLKDAKMYKNKVLKHGKIKYAKFPFGEEGEESLDDK